MSVITLTMPGDEPGTIRSIDLDTLTPRARAIAEALAQAKLPRIKIRSVRPARELHVPEYLPMLFDDPDAPETRIHDSWWKWHDLDPEPSIHTVLEWEAQKLDGWYPVADDGTDLPSSQAARADDSLNRDQALALIQAICPGAGISIDTWMRNATRGIKGYPAPVRHNGHVSLWSEAAVRAWATRLAGLADLGRQRERVEQHLRERVVEMAELPDELVAKLAGITRVTARKWTGKE
ncbi:hypothetical protein [Micromonospora sp. WMMD1082]|uniref:hypothetical protein n=1 Tax=Micromonospora sp. WMMD1082 TaxID=3016104 RepID=UPI002415ED50|nr:hypothetical protein [Micromonospora sp. WMMD1082]MDG4795085.1 hypothetical protein [Micromonospora sp. WMMD1082]